MNKILLVEDNDEIRELLKVALTLKDFDVLEAVNGQEAIAKMAENHPDLVILDLILPDMDGMDICKRWKENTATKDTPVLMVTGRTRISDRVMGLETGADDYIVKPFDTLELLARVKVLLRRAHPQRSAERQHLKVGDLELDPSNYTILQNGSPVFNLTTREFDILYVLMNESPKPVSRETILEAVWGKPEKGDSRVIDIHIANIRKKIGQDKIKTISGKGYLYI